MLPKLKKKPILILIRLKSFEFQTYYFPFTRIVCNHNAPVLLWNITELFYIECTLSYSYKISKIFHK